MISKCIVKMSINNKKKLKISTVNKWQGLNLRLLKSIETKIRHMKIYELKLNKIYSIGTKLIF